MQFSWRITCPHTPQKKPCHIINARKIKVHLHGFQKLLEIHLGLKMREVTVYLGVRAHVTVVMRKDALPPGKTVVVMGTGVDLCLTLAGPLARLC